MTSSNIDTVRRLLREACIEAKAAGYTIARRVTLDQVSLRCCAIGALTRQYYVEKTQPFLIGFPTFGSLRLGVEILSDAVPKLGGQDIEDIIHGFDASGPDYLGANTSPFRRLGYELSQEFVDHSEVRPC